MKYKLVDLSHTVEHGLVTYKGLPAPAMSDFLSREDSRKLYDEGTEFHIGRIEMIANTGTYVDSPYHRFAEGADLSKLGLEKLANLEGVIVKADQGDNQAINLPLSEMKAFQDKAVLFHTGWSQYWNTHRYHENYPYLTRETALNLLEAGASLVGIDSLNIDDNRDGSRPVHTILLEAGIPIVEHLTNLHLLPPDNFRFYAVPVKIRGFGSFPVRAFAQVPIEK